MMTWFHKRSLKFKIQFCTFGPLIIFALLVFFQQHRSILQALEESMGEGLSDTLKISAGLIDGHYNQWKQGELVSEQEAQKHAKEEISLLRFGPGLKNYFYLLDSNGVMIAHPDKKLIGTSMIDFKDVDGVPFFKQLIENAKADITHPVFYRWPNPERPELLDNKMAVAIKSPYWGWYLVTTMPTNELVATSWRASGILLLTIFGFLTGICILLYFLLNRVAIYPLEAMSKKIRAESLNVSQESQKIAQSSLQLSEASTQQATSLQETVSGIDEISAMVSKTAESAKQSQVYASQSEQASQSGRLTVDKMLTAINDINESNNLIMNQMENNNKNIEEIVKVIANIGDKTKVINDIVFQTKLLSFNASVEAARAGAHGKGFAVVAEEVGNLATMSGNAAKDISSLLEKSISSVKSIVEQTKSSVTNLMALGREKVEMGRKTADECKVALDHISSNISQSNKMSEEIGLASREQADGVKEITKAMGQLDTVTQQNSLVAQQTSEASKHLMGLANNLGAVVDQMEALLAGLKQSDRVAAPLQPALPAKRPPQNVLPIATSVAKKVPPKVSATLKPATPQPSVSAVPDSSDTRFKEVV